MNSPASPVDRVRALILPTLSFLGFELYDLKVLGSGRGAVLRVTIDRPEGVSLDDCEKVSQSLGPLLDQADPFPDRYTLEVSSPGAERPLRSLDEYRRFLGMRANIRYRFDGGERVAEGRLTAVSPGEVVLEMRDHKQVTIAFPDIEAARLAVDL